MKNCVECNELLEDDARFCSNFRAEQPERKIELVEPKESAAAQEPEKSNPINSSEDKTKMDYSLCYSPSTRSIGFWDISGELRLLRKAGKTRRRRVADM